MTSATATRWQLQAEPPAEARCVFCETDGPLVDTGLELDGERRLYVCPDCVTGLARTARVGSKAAEALRGEYEAEVRGRDERLSALADQLDQRAQQIKTLEGELARLREAHERDAHVTRQIRTLTEQLTP